jgi:hypothetical protein
MRFQRRVHCLLGVEGVLEHPLGVGERFRGIATPEVKIERDIGVATTGEVLQIGKGAGRLQLIVDEDRRGERLDFIEHRRHRLVVDFDRLRRLFGNMRVGCEHCRDRLADMANLALGEDRLVVKRRAVIGLGDDGADIGGGDDAVYPGDRGSGAGFDAADPPMRLRASADLAVEHPGKTKTQIVDVFGRARDLCAGFEPWQRAADLPRRKSWLVAHHAAPASARCNVRRR